MSDYGYGPPSQLPRDNVQMVAYGVVAVSVVGAVIIALTTFGGHSSSDASGSNAGGGYTPPATQTFTNGNDTGGVTGQPATDSASTGVTSLPGDLESYVGPEGITVQGPSGWREDRSAHVPTVLDYNEPSSPARLAGATFRIGVGNPTPAGTFHSEADAAANFLRKTFDATIYNGPEYLSFRGAQCADIEYQYYNTNYRVKRHGIERIWRENGQTYTIQSSGTEDGWDLTQQVFSELIANASVD